MLHNAFPRKFELISRHCCIPYNQASSMSNRVFFINVGPNTQKLKGGGCWSNFRGEFFLMNFELLTFVDT